MKSHVRAIALSLAAWVCAASARASDHTNLEDGQPTTVTDAYATNYLNREVQALVGYERTKEGANVFSVTPRFELGFPRNAQVSVGMPFLGVTGEQFYLGRANAEFLYNLNEETLVLPALAIVAAVDAPTGRDRQGQVAHGFDPIARAYLTKGIPGTSYWNRVHVNGSYQFNASRGPGERAGRYMVAAGYGFRIASPLVGIVDAAREQRMTLGEAENYAELGFRYQVNPLLVVNVGGGVGFAEQSSPVRATASLQYRAF